MTTSGFRVFDAKPLDPHEFFDGHILIFSDIGQEGRLPFHLLLCQTASPKFAMGLALPLECNPIDQNFTIINQGFGTAQIDAFELVYSDKDDTDASYGVLEVDLDCCSIGWIFVQLAIEQYLWASQAAILPWSSAFRLGSNPQM